MTKAKVSLTALCLVLVGLVGGLGANSGAVDPGVQGGAQAQAGPGELRTAPLWGLGQRIFLLHDGRTTDLLAAIQAHKSPRSARFPASEANAVVDNFNRPSDAQKQDVLNFLRSL